MGILIRNMNATTGISNVRTGKMMKVLRNNIGLSDFTLNNSASFDPSNREGSLSGVIGSCVLFNKRVNNTYIEIEHHNTGNMVFGFSSVYDYDHSNILGNFSNNDSFNEPATVTITNSQVVTNDVSSFILRDGYIYYFKNGNLLHTVSLSSDSGMYLKLSSHLGSGTTTSFKIVSDNNLYHQCTGQI